MTLLTAIVRRRPLRLAVLGAAALAAVAAAGEERTGRLTYRAEDNLSMREGTIELWLNVGYDVNEFLPSTDKYEGLLAIARVEGDAGAFNIGHFAGAGYKPEAGLYVSLGSSKTELHGFFCGKFLPEPGEWRHLALTWQGKRLRFYLDGKLTGERTSPEFLHLAFGPVGAKPILLGDRWERRGRMAIDEFRVSSVARRPDELGFHGRLAPDPFTMILDDFEAEFTPDGKRRTTPLVIFAGDGGLPDKRCEFVDGKFGKGLALFTDTRQPEASKD